ncbi:MAG: GAF domain-containing protein [Gemmatimonadetes bacterium]|nr:GAF domain-containing protein [Gemmatimonadota bacterium]MYD13741.1 GAF domain-containing protein [Gemmatimonadota bacterium]
MIDARAVVTEIQEMREDGHLSDALLRHAARTLYNSDDRFDWVGIYLLTDDRLELWLHNYFGAPTEHAKIPVGEGVCGKAVAHGANQNVPDVTEFEGYLACSPDVRSELVVLIRAGSEIYGQFDIDSNQADAFENQDEVAIQMVADKLAEQLAHERR